MTHSEQAQKEFAEICMQLKQLMLANKAADDPLVQEVIARHCTWLRQFWVPTKEAYIGLSEAYKSDAFAPVFSAYHEGLADFMAEAMKEYAERKW